ncbi:hypothetical protein BCV70DRAFT_202417 [Testicularia cyperi]|uniref:Meiotically up-regulated protein Msb1/Mug8 domain-containing protein n=1 Tax=Testicularia cyperi TaxID=1882483 RepID=A0A317XJG9_9BASI|nr:hypothetical protein BCV70DRAFT_202417 [Testicularia cyperi]
MTTVAPSPPVAPTANGAGRTTSAVKDPSSNDSRAQRKLFGRSRKSTAPSPSADPLGGSSIDSYPEKGNISTSALSNTSAASAPGSRASRFFRRFTRSGKAPPPVPSLPPSLVLDLDAGTAATSASGQPIAISQQDVAAIRSMQQQGPSAAAAFIAQSNAAFAAAANVPKPVGEQRRKMLDAMANARLNVAQARDLVRICGLQIRERGLDTMGLFRSFRIAESQDRVMFMIQLFLLSIDTSTYLSVFPVLPENALDQFGQQTSARSSTEQKRRLASEELDKELRYASVHEVVAVMKWGLRHLRLLPGDFHSKDADEWYDMFVIAERESGYHARAIADLLHPRLPQETAELLSEVIDLLASVAAHSTSNHMPAATLCKVLGFWLFGRIGVAHPPPVFDELREATDKAARIAEHLLLAHIRSQAAVTFSMPLRLTELVEGYPYIAPGADAPSLPPAFSTRPVQTLRIDLKSDNLVVSQTKPRTPSATLAAALDATASGNLQGNRGETWAAVMSQLDGDAAGNQRGQDLLMEEHARILKLVDDEMAVRTKTDAKDGESKGRATAEAPTAGRPFAGRTSSATINGVFDADLDRRRSQSTSDLRSGAVRAALSPLIESSGLPSTDSKHAALKVDTATEDDPVEVVADDAREFEQAHGSATDGAVFSSSLEPSSSWRSFSEEGFGEMSTASSDLSLSEFDIKPVGASQTLPSRRSNRSLYRTKSSSSSSTTGGGGPRRPGLSHAYTLPNANTRTSAPTMTHTVTSAKMEELDTGLSILWQDQLLDNSPCCSLPCFVFVQLNERAATASALGSETTANADRAWLLIVETIIPPRPPTPPPSAGGSGRRSRWDADSFSDRKSILAPSLRSVRSTLRRVSTIIGVGSHSRKKAPPASSTDDNLTPI